MNPPPVPNANEGLGSREVRRSYDQMAATYERRWSGYVDATLRSLIEVADLTGADRVLDVPCGTGSLVERLLPIWPGLAIVGADLSGAMLERARRKPIRGRVSWVQADAHHLPFGDATFDVLLSANSFHFFRAPRAAIREFRRVLRPGGRLLLLDWCDDFLACKLCGAWLRLTDPAHQAIYTLRECSSMLEAGGFSVESADRLRITWLWGLMRLVAVRG